MISAEAFRVLADALDQAARSATDSVMVQFDVDDDGDGTLSADWWPPAVDQAPDMRCKARDLRGAAAAGVAAVRRTETVPIMAALRAVQAALDRQTEHIGQ